MSRFKLPRIDPAKIAQRNAAVAEAEEQALARRARSANRKAKVAQFAPAAPGHRHVDVSAVEEHDEQMQNLVATFVTARAAAGPESHADSLTAPLPYAEPGDPMI